MERILLNAPSMQAEITIGVGALEDRLPRLVGAENCFWFTDETVYHYHGARLNGYFGDTPKFVMPSGEEHKNFNTLQNLLSAMTSAGLTRKGTLFIVGGGVVGDVGGLAAALYMRGIRCVQIPTTLLAQVDSSVGGKTAIDHDGVKNIVGAFYQPSEVIIDPEFLETLPPREIKCGLGEIVKYAALDAELYAALEQAKSFHDLAFLKTLVSPCVRYKAGVVERDEKESGERKSLNVGHTTGHAVELFYNLSHGESVLFGMALETQIAVDLGVCEKEHGEKLLSIVEKALGESRIEFGDFSFAALAKSDKKNEKKNEIVLSVAKSLGEWTTLSLAFDDYLAALQAAAKKCFTVNNEE